MISVGVPFLVSILIHGTLIRDLITENYRDTTMLTLQSIANHIDSYVDSCENFFFQYLFDENLERFYLYADKHEISTEDKKVFYDYYIRSTKYRNAVIKYMAASNEYLKGIAFIPEHHNTDTIFLLKKNVKNVEMLDLYQKNYEALLNRVKEIELSQVLICRDTIEGEYEGGSFTIAKKMNQIEKARRQGYVFMEVSTEMFEAVMSDFQLDDQVGVILSYPDMQMAYSTSDEISLSYEEIENKTEARKSECVTINKTKYDLYSIQSAAGFYIDYLIPQSAIIGEVARLYGVFAAVWLGAVLVAFMLYNRLFYRIRVATARIVGFAESYKLDRKEYEIEQNQNSGIAEFDSIGMALRDMKKRIEALVEEEYILKLNQQAAEYKAMQTEINPHFLNNVLSSLVALNRLGERKNLETAILNLSQMFRYTCEHSYDSYIEQECRFIESYLMLEKLRFEKRLEYRIMVEEEAGKLVIPKLLIQPLVENAMKHGFVDGMDMKIVIRASKLEEKGRKFVWLVVANTGQPIDQKKALSSSGVGLQSVRERLEIVYPGSCMWFSAYGEFQTVCNILIPVDEKEKR